MAGKRLAVTCWGDHVVRVIDVDTLTSKTVGGLSKQSGWVDGVQPQLVRFNYPSGIAVSSNGGMLVVTDQGSNRLRVVEKICSPFYVVVEGKCLPCDAIPCGLGKYRSACRFTQTDGVCTACPYTLPQNALWGESGLGLYRDV